MPADHVIIDRFEALEAMSADQLGEMLAELPLVVSRTAPPVTRRKLATALADNKTLLLSPQLASPQALQLLIVARAYGGSMTEEDVARETPLLSAERRAELVAELTRRVIIDPSRGHLVIRPGFEFTLPSPGRSISDSVRDGRTTADMLREHLSFHGVTKVAGKKQDLLTAFLAVVSDHEALLDVVRSLSNSAQVIFEQLYDAGLSGCAINDFGVSGYQVVSFLRYGSVMNPDPAARAISELRAFGLIFFDEYENTITLWREVLHAFNGRLYDIWPASFEGTPVGSVAGNVRPPSCTGNLGAVMRLIASDPMPGLKSGGIGVKTYRSIAKQINQSERSVIISISIARLLGLIEEETRIVGRGRNSSLDYRYSVVGEAWEAFRALPIPEQWRQMVTVHLANTFGGMDLVFGDVCRQILADLVALDDDLAIAEADIDSWVRLRHAMTHYSDIDSILEDFRALDLTENASPLRLTALGRVMLTEPDLLDERFPQLDTMFVVQADQTVIAPPALDPEIRSRLEALAELVSDSSVRVYRLVPTKIAGALAGSETATTITEFLASHSSVPLPPATAQMIIDTERQRGGLTVAAAATIVTAADVLGLAAAVKVKAARLTLIAPTVAVSDLAPARVTAALRAKGLAPTVTAPGADASSPPVRRHSYQPSKAVGRKKQVSPILLSPTAIAELANGIR